MGFPARLMNGVSTTSGNLNTLVAGTITPGATLQVSTAAFGTISATCTFLAETNTITLSAVWQVSNDASTWLRAVDENDAAPVAVGTGTAGADSAVTRVVAAPRTVYGWRYVRCGVLNGVVTGATADTYSIAYNYAAQGL